MRIGIVGSRRRNALPDRRSVWSLVEKSVQLYGNDLVIVSGGCHRGADHFAEEAARTLKVETQIFPIPSSPPIMSSWEFARRAHARNRLIVENCDVLYALIHESRTGGTENTISHAHDLKKRVFLIGSDGSIYLDPNVPDDPDKA